MTKDGVDGVKIIGGLLLIFVLVLVFYVYGVPFLFHTSAAWDKYLLRVLGA